MPDIRRSVFLALASAVLVAGFGGCGGDDSEDVSEERISQERREAAQIARQEERVKQLERELRERQRGDGQAAPEPGPAPSAPPSSGTAPAGTTSCGDGVYVNSVTTCPFAHNVRAEYNSSGGSGDMTVEAYSAATGQRYVMTCSGGSPHVCFGGNDARIYFP
ncbi:MAG TPA: hypothetical protein VD790_00770 [Thermoleophilaceae bacterium]|nr:hypothetical protein [Thermoleophilaceae bacterium]